MKLGPKYKIARRVGAPIFEKTQTQKYAQRAEQKKKNAKFGRPKSEFGLQLNEKQKARFTYGLTEKQFANYVKEALLKRSENTASAIYEFLEKRIDNVVARIGLSSTRSGARQMVSHGHIVLNGRRITIPSIRVKIGDKIEIREASKSKGLFKNVEEKIKNVSTPAWIKFDADKKTAEVVSMPQLSSADNLMFDLNAIIEFYSR